MYIEYMIYVYTMYYIIYVYTIYVYKKMYIYNIHIYTYMYTFLLKSPTCEPTDNALWALLDVHLLLVFMQDPVL